MLQNLLESAKIVALCIAAAVIYGIAHDQVTARICPEYFTIGHVDVGLRSPTALGLFWGVVATWWVGAILGGLLVLVSRVGPEPRLVWRELSPRVAAVMGGALAAAVVAGLCSAIAQGLGLVWPTDGLIARVGGEAVARRFLVDAWIHVASYAVAFVGGLAALGASVAERVRLAGRDG